MQLYLRISSVLLPLNIGPVICARPCECRHLGGRRVSVAALGVEMLTSSIRPRISGSSSAASTDNNATPKKQGTSKRGSKKSGRKGKDTARVRRG